MPRKFKDLDQAIRIFAEGSRIHHSGLFFQSQQMAAQGILVIDTAMAFIDANGPEGRDVLTPLLNHHEDSVRVTAASALIASMPHIALPVIHDIRERCLKEARTTATLVLIAHEVFGDYVLSPCRPDPRYPIPGAANDSTASDGKS